MADEILTLGVEVEVKNALKGISTFERQLKQKMANVTKAVGKLGHTNARVLEKALELSEDWIDDVDRLAVAHSKEAQALLNLNDTIEKQEQLVRDLSEAKKKGSEEEQKSAKAELDRAEAYLKAIKKRGQTEAKVMSDNLLKRGQFARFAKETSESIEKGLEAARPAVSSFFGKDLKGTLEGTMSFAGKALGKAVEHFRKKEADGGGGGAAAAGGAMKAAGGAAGKMGGILNIVSKLGPLIGTLSSVIMAVVKVLIDAEAQAKEFNKEILASASNAEFLAAAGGNVSKAFADMDKVTKGIRDAAYSWDTMKWGNADDFKATISGLLQEGVSLQQIGQQADAAGKSVEKFTGELVHASVAYSKAFGVPIQEITQLQAEMFTDMGVGLQQTQFSFAQMTRDMAESGIAANKFYATIRSVSQDLSLYNVRMAQATKTLGLLGKVMNPRDAAKFMQFATQGLKGMGQDDRLKVALLTGAKGQKIVEKDLANKRELLYKDIASAIGKSDAAGIKQVKADLAKGGDAAKAIWEAIPKEQRGGLRGEARELELSERSAKKGVYGRAEAMGNLGAGASLELAQAALAPWGGGKTINEGIGSIGMTKMAENLGYSTDQLRAMAKLETAIEMEREELLKSGKITQKEIDSGAVSTQDIIDRMSEDMTAEEKKAIEDANKSELDIAKEQKNLTTSLMDRLGELVDFVMNQLYNALLGIWDGIMSSIPDALKSEETKRQEQVLADIKAVKKYGNDPELLKLAESGSTGSTALANTQAGKNAAALIEAWKNSRVATRSGGPGSMEYSEVQRLSLRRNQLKNSDSEADQKELAGIDDRLAKLAKLDAVVSRTISGVGAAELTVAMAGAGFSPDVLGGGDDESQLKDALAKDPEKAAKVFMSLGTSNLTDLSRLGSVSKELGYGVEGPGKKGVDPKKQDQAADATVEGAKASQDLYKDASTANTLYFKYPDDFKKELGRMYEKGVLDSVRTALWEFYLYSEEEDRGKLLEEMDKRDFSPAGFAEQLGNSKQTVGGFLGYSTTEAPANAAGGLVTGIGSDGLATIRAAAGEGLTSIGRGEAIVPRGGALARTGNAPARVEISVQRGFEQFIDAKITEGIQDFKRREKFS